MKIAKLNTTPFQTTREGIINNYYVVEDDYDFIGNLADDVTSYETLSIFAGINRYNYRIFRQSLIDNIVPVFSGLTNTDIKSMIFNRAYPSGFTESDIISYVGVDGLNLINRTHSESELNYEDIAAYNTGITAYTASTAIRLAGKVVWKGGWSGGTYQENDMVLDGVWTMIANKETTDLAAPQKVGSPEDLYSPNNPSISGTTAKQIVFGMQYSGNQPFWLEGYRTFVIAGNEYNIILIKDPDGANEVTFLNLFRATVTGWRDFGLVPRPVASGVTFQILAIVQEPDPTPTTTDIDYNYHKPTNWTAPTTGQIVHAGKRLQVLSIHHIDQDAIDRTAFLNALVVGDIISVGGTNWSIQNNVDEGTYNDISVAPALQASVSSVQTFSFETVTATPISIAIDPDYWSGSTQVKGVYIKNGNWDDAVIDDNQYGIDIKVQHASLSPDWDIVTSQGNGGSSSSNANTSWGFVGGNILNQIDLQNQFETKLDITGFTSYTGTTAPATYALKSNFNLFTGTTAPNTYQTKTSINILTGTTLPNQYAAKSAFLLYTGTTAPNTFLTKATFNAYTASTATQQIILFSTGSTDLNTIIPSTIAWHVQRRYDTTHFLFTGGTNIRILTAGIYEISYQVNIANANAAAKSISSNIYVNGSISNDTLASAFFQTNGTVSQLALVPLQKTFAANDLINLRGYRVLNAGATSIVPNSVFISVRKKT